MATSALLMAALLAQHGACTASIEEARQAFEARQFDRAAVAFESALPQCPDRAAVLLSLGQVRYLLGKDVEAEEALVEAIRLKPDETGVRYALGRIYYQQNRFPEAIEQFQKVLDIDPKHYRAHDNLALCYAGVQKDSDALRHFFKALDLIHKDHPDYDSAYANLANFFLDRNEHEKAFQLAAEAAQRNPDSARNFFLAGKALVKLNKFDLSVRWLEQATRLDSEYSEPRYLLAQVYRRLGRAEDAARELERFRELSKLPRPRR